MSFGVPPEQARDVTQEDIMNKDESIQKRFTGVPGQSSGASGPGTVAGLLREETRADGRNAEASQALALLHPEVPRRKFGRPLSCRSDASHGGVTMTGRGVRGWSFQRRRSLGN